MLRKQAKWIYRLLRQIVFSCWWWPTEEEMKGIATHYGYGVKIVNSFPKNDRIGECSYRNKLLSILRKEHRVFWHELGHAVDHQKKHSWYFPKFFPERLAGGIIFLRSELLATILGFQLAFQWRKELPQIKSEFISNTGSEKLDHPKES